MDEKDLSKINAVREFLKNTIYVGIKESDCIFTEYFKTITLFGTNKNGNVSFNGVTKKRLNHNDKRNIEEQTLFFTENILNYLKNNKNLKISFYNKYYFYMQPETIIQKGVFEVEKSLYDFYNDKFESKIWANKIVPCLEYKFLKGKEISYEKCLEIFDEKKGAKFVVQGKDSISGSGTFFLNNKNIEKVTNRLNNEDMYIVSKYLENNIPINFHVLISKNDFIILPASIQLIKIIDNNLSYEGADFYSYNKVINSTLNKKIIKYVKSIVKKMQKMGYIGVAGIDFICSSDEAYFMEINARFQSSTVVLNYVLNKNDLPTVNELDAMCFMFDKLIKIPKIEVPYSKITINKDVKDIYNDIKALTFYDGFTVDEKLDNNVYLYTKLIQKSIF